MSAFNLSVAIQDRRFAGDLRLCWFSFGDGDGISGINMSKGGKMLSEWRQLNVGI